LPGRLAILAIAFLALSAPAQARVKVGSLMLHRCANAYCGALERPLDPRRAHSRTISVGFRYLPAARRARGPAIVAVEGGPGYPSIGSEVEYRGIYRPLLRERDLLLVDNRGTGRSARIDCEILQTFTGRTSGWAFAQRVRACADQIDRRFGAHATDYFGTRDAVADLAAVLRRLRLGRVDLYGDSYGTFFTQHFMARHPELLHSVVLDSAYPVRDLDPWYASSGEAARRALETVSPGSVARLGQLLARLRVRPLGGRVDVRAVADMVQDSGSDPVILRELDASVRAALAGDTVPLLRLARQSRAWNHGPSEAGYFSGGLYFAVSCRDYPQLFSLSAPPRVRRLELAASLRLAPDAFQPFTPAEWLTISGYSQPYDVCLDWPHPVRRDVTIPDRPLPATVPVLILGGDLDSLTPLADAQVFGPKLGANVRVVTLPNTVHVTSEGDTLLVHGANCGRRIIRAFTRAPSASLDTRCAGHIPALHTPDFQGAPATLVSGPDPGEAVRREVTVAANAFADSIVRHFYSDDTRGLRGGRFTATGSRIVHFRLRRVRFTADTRTSGTGSWDAATGAVRARLIVGRTIVRVNWTPDMPTATAKVRGAVLSLPAP
jgi:pimeloyl-ACP methyl ester carboxylesterase